MPDKNNKSYRTVCINGQYWMAENMDYEISALGSDYFYPNGESNNRATYGLLYTWYTAITVCP